MNQKHHRYIFIKIVSWGVVFLWMILIFSLSSQGTDVSNRLTAGITEKLVNLIKAIVPNVNIDTINFNHIIRKNSHFLIFFFFGFLLTITLRGNGVHKYRNKVLAFIICALYAVLDEIHQIFVPGRGAQILDVCIDCAGAIAGIGVYVIVSMLLKRSRILNKINRSGRI